MPIEASPQSQLSRKRTKAIQNGAKNKLLCNLNMWFDGYHQNQWNGHFFMLSSRRHAIKVRNSRLMIRKIQQFLWYQNCQNFEKKWDESEQAPLKGHWTIFWNFLLGWISFIMLYATANLQIQREKFKKFPLKMKKSSLFVKLE